MPKDNLRTAHNYLFQAKGNDYVPEDLTLLGNYLEFSKQQLAAPKKIALLLVSVNSNYWTYAGQIVEDAQKYFLPGHKTDILLWSDMPQLKNEEVEKKIKDIDSLSPDPTAQIFGAVQKYIEALYVGKPVDEQMIIVALRVIGIDSEFIPIPNSQLRNLMIKNHSNQTVPQLQSATRTAWDKYKNLQNSCTVFEVEPIEWPYGTLMRYSMFLQQEEALKDYDYIFYMDVDMRIVNVVGDEILGQRLTIAPHPGYFLRKELYPPYEPNSASASYIKRPGKVIVMDGKPRFVPFYAAGGFQGGTGKSYIKAMKETKKLIDKDFNINYIPIWNDETAWNKYVFDLQTQEEINQTIFLTPSYIYPDSLIKEYYERFWGQSYPPKIITLTKPFTVQKIDMSKFNTM